jgi:hypothetical protein
MNGNHPRTTAPIEQITPAHKTPARAYLEFFFPNEKGNADPDSLNG